MKLHRNTTGNICLLLEYLKNRILNSNKYKLTKRVVEYLHSEDCTLPVSEKASIRKYFPGTIVYQISYPFCKEYLYKRINVSWDNAKLLYYVYHNKRKLFFRKGLSKSKIRYLYNSLCLEQDTRSPHSYFAFPIDYRATDIVADIGAAEGIWALDIVEKVKEIYLFECDETWIEALQATFEPWKNKIHIVNKFVTDFTDGENTTLDDYFYGKNIFPDIIKADIEGAEVACMKGASKLLNQHISHAIVCTYHNYDDFIAVSEIMKQYQFKIQPSDGYMITIYSEPDYTCKDITKLFRKGLIHAYK